MSKRAVPPSGTPEGLDPRSRIIAAGVRLVAEQGALAATTRGIAAAASVQAPTIFRHFGDKNGLLDAIAAQTMSDFLRSGVKTTLTDDPLQDLRAGIEAFMAFGVSNPDVFIHMYARPGSQSAPMLAGYQALRDRIHRVALIGRLSVTEERACDIFHAMARGTVSEMLDRPAEARDGMIQTASGVALQAVTTPTGEAQVSSMESCASTLRAQLGDTSLLSPGERLLLSELLGRLADGR